MKFFLRALEPLYGRFLSFERAHELTKYGIVGFSGLGVNLCVNYILHDHIWYLYASIIAFIVTLTWSFTLQKIWTFAERSVDRIHIQFGITIVVALTNLGINTMLMYLAVSVFGFYYLYAQAVITLFIGAEAYLINRYIIFRAPRTEVQN